MQLNTIIFFCLLIATIHAASLQRQPTKQSPYDHLRSVRGTKSCSSDSCPFWEKHGRSFVSLRCYAQQFQECTCLHRMCFRSCLYSQAVCNAEMAHCIEQICPRCSSAAEKHLCAAQNPLVGQMLQSLNNFACYPCCAGTAGANSPLNGNTTNLAVNALNKPTNNAPVNGNAPKPVNGNAPKPVNGNAPKPVNGNAPKPVNGNANKPVNGNANKPVNANANKPVNGNVNKPVNGNANKPVNGNAPKPVNGNANKPVNGNAPKPVNGNAPKPVNGNAPLSNNVNQVGNNLLAAVGSSNGASLNQRVKTTKKTTSRLTKTTKRQTATVRTTPKSQNKSKTTKRTTN